MMMPGRSFSAGGGYRFGFNGKENDNEVKGEGNQQDYGMRIYDGRLGRFLSVDPLSKKFAFYTPYQFASNCPILAVDLDGLESSDIPNVVEKAADGSELRLPGHAKILARLESGQKTIEGVATNAVTAGVNTFSIDGSTFSARFRDGKFTRYAEENNTETYDPDKYVFGGYSSDVLNQAEVENNKRGYAAIKNTAGLNFTYFGLKTHLNFVSAEIYNYTDWKGKELAIVAGTNASLASGDITARLGTTNNNVFGEASGKIMSAEAIFATGIMTGENNKYGLGINAGAGGKVAEGDLKFGGTFLGMKMAGTVGATAVSAHIGVDGGLLYDSNTGNLDIKIGANAGLLFGGKVGVAVSIPVRDWVNTVNSWFQ